MGMRKITIPMKEFIEYCKENYILGIILAAVIALVYGEQAFSTDFYVDAEVIINSPRTVYNWDQIGRFGLIWLKLLLGGNWYNPYFEGALFLVTLWCVGMGSCYLLSIIIGKADTVVNVIFASLFLIFPTYADQFMFRFQAFEVAFAMLLIVFASRYFYLYYTQRSKGAFVAAVYMEVFSFGIYQSMVNLQICFFIAIYIFCINSCNRKERRKLIGLEILQFIIGFVIYECIAKLFFSGGEYLTNQIGWFSGDLYVTIRNLLAYVKRILLALDTFYPITYTFCVCFGLGILLWAALRQKENFIAYFIGIVGMLGSPFFLALVTGTPTAYRAQCMLPFACAVIWIYTAELIKKKKTFYRISILFGIIFVLMHSAVLMRMQYTQDVIREADRIQAVQMMDRIHQINGEGDSKPVVFLGHLEAKTNGACYTKEQAASFLSYSAFEFAYVVGVPIDMPNYYNTGRVLGFFETLGFSYSMPTQEMVKEAESIASEIPCWPASDSIRETEKYILVKLSE